MKGYRKTSHSVYDLKYHLVFITKFRKPVINYQLRLRIRDLTRQVCKEQDVKIIRGNVRTDHVHLLVSVPPTLSVSKLMQSIKGFTSRKIQMEYNWLKKEYWGKHFWARGYFAASCGNVSEGVVEEYIKNQDLEEELYADNFEA